MTVVVGEGIINGKKAENTSLQYMVSVQVEGKHHCGGFLISPHYVLTAAHCEREQMTIVLGDHNINPQRNLKRYDVVCKFIPKSFKDAKLDDDIMLLKLSRKASGKYVKTVKISDENHRVKPNTSCMVSGWGSTKRHKTVHNLLALNVSTVKIHDCKDAWNNYIEKLPPNIICAGGYEQNGGVRWGDSGGPLVCNSMAVGIVSFNLIGFVYPNVPSIYTDITKYARWSKAMMKKGM